MIIWDKYIQSAPADGFYQMFFSPQEAVGQYQMALVPPLVAGVVAEVPCPAGGYLFILARAYRLWHHRLKVSQVTHRAKDTVNMLIPQSAELWHKYHVLPVTKKPPASRLEAIRAPGIMSSALSHGGPPLYFLSCYLSEHFLWAPHSSEDMW